MFYSCKGQTKVKNLPKIKGKYLSWYRDSYRLWDGIDSKAVLWTCKIFMFVCEVIINYHSTLNSEGFFYYFLFFTE